MSRTLECRTLECQGVSSVPGLRDAHPDRRHRPGAADPRRARRVAPRPGALLGRQPARAPRAVRPPSCCAPPTPCGASCGRPTSSASPGPTSPATPRSRATCWPAIRAVFQAAPDGPAIGTRTVARTLVGGGPAGRARAAAAPARPRRPGCGAAATRRERDAAAISHHYDVGNDFYRLVLGESMTYSCARFARARRHPRRGPGGQVRPDLPQARAAARACGCSTSAAAGAAWPCTPRPTTRWPRSGITLSEQQYDLARKRVAEAGLADWVEIRLQDYRDVAGERRRALRRHQLHRDVRARRARTRWRPTSRCWPGVLEPGRAAAQPRHLDARTGRRSTGAASRPATCSPTVSWRTWPTWSRPWRRSTSRSATSSRCGSTTP